MFDLTIEVILERFSGVTVDDLGNEVDSYAPGVAALVFAFEPQKSGEPKLAGHDRIVVDREMYAPISMQVGPKDRIIYAGQRFEVVGWPEDPNANPWFEPELVTVNLHRIEG